ncbi:MAG: YagK/YfjJ domain-containing protein [Pseudomonas sp.]
MTHSNSYTGLSQSDIALQIERLVLSIERHVTPAFRFEVTRSGSERIERTYLSRYFKYIRQMLDLFQQDYPYQCSEQLRAFWEACQSIGLERGIDGPVCWSESASTYLCHRRSMNVLVDRIRRLTGEQWYRRAKGDRRQQAKTNGRRVCDYTDALISRYSRTLIIRVNLYYYQTVQLRLRVERVFEDLDRLTAEHERNPIFNHLLGYIYAVEQGDDRGYHIHAAYFFNGNEVYRDIYKAQQIGELWVRITQGQGYFDSCNHDKEEKYRNKKHKQEQEQEKEGELEKQRELGIGMIFRKDKKVRPHVHYAMCYLVKDAQQVRLKPVRARCLRMGQISR